METKDYEASMLQPKKVTITNTTDNEFDLQMYRVNLQLLIGGRSSKYPDGQEVDFIIESSEEYVYYASVIENLGDEWNIDNNHKISIAFEDAGGGSAVLIEKSITANGEYNASDDEADGYSKVTVNVPASGLDYGWESYAEDHQGVLQDYWLTEGVTRIEIPSSVTSIGSSAFSSFKSLQEVVIPHSVASIGEIAFWDCTSLTQITIPNSVETLGHTCFSTEYGGSLESVTFEAPCQLTSLPNECFSYQALESIVIPDSITSIGNSCFSSCRNLQSVVLPSSLTELGDDAFSSCNFETIELPNSLTTIGEWCFGGCIHLAQITIPASVETIGGGAFSCYGQDESALESITFETPSSLTSIGMQVFQDQKHLQSITIPASVETIGEECFDGCEALETITINKPEDSIEGAPWGAPETTQIIWNG